MSEFKAGEKVITTKQGGWYKVGEVFTLTKPYFGENIAGWHTEEQGEGWFIRLDSMKLYQPNLKSMLQNGMRVKLRNGGVHTVVDGNFASIEDNRLFWGLELSRLKDDLSYRTEYNEFRQYDVMEIYEKPLSFGDYFDYDVKTKPLWKREEETESEKQLKILQEQIQTLTEQAIKLGEQIKLEKL